ncbi:MAG: acyl-CoA dehydrogenase family protein [Mycobacterium sp.]|uniref:acyl-CoA dehydrogenase family protein n=1 Tax=Mycobacterium sp. TaxID=1785 RepID=UPI003F959C16
MDYSLDEQQRDVRDLAQEILASRVTADRLTELEASDNWFDTGLWGDLAQAGLIGIAIPEDQGGSGAGFVELCLVIEEIARVAAHLFLVESATAALAITRFGTDALRDALVRPFCAGDLLLSSAITVDGVASRGLSAREVSGTWQVTGELSHVPLLDKTARVLVAASDDAGNRGIFLLDPTTAGITVTAQSSIDRRPRWQLAAAAGVAVPAADVLIAPGSPAEEAEACIRDWTLVARCMTQLGHSEAALDMTASYVSERRQFGRPIGSFQAVAHRAANAYIDVLGIRLTAWRAAWLVGRGTPDAEATAIAGWWASDAATRVVEAAMHLHGGLSVDMDYPLHRHYLAVKQCELALGGPSRRMLELGDLIGA